MLRFLDYSPMSVRGKLLRIIGILALTVALVCGAVVYYFMPDAILGRLDDWAALCGSGAFFILVRYGFRGRKRQPAAPKAP